MRLFVGVDCIFKLDLLFPQEIIVVKLFNVVGKHEYYLNNNPSNA